MAHLEKNAWHDIRSSLTAIKLGVKLLREEIFLPEMNQAEVRSILDEVERKLDLSVEQIEVLRENQL